ncbi:CACTA en-spm transposon protein [Cucumis melo var. makuwa]|uniref:CACTA en-spm transposon protein n=1 Tax=Cucumis melo var. makuwa TaxID=1194695 RepID=A0A5A7V8R4_CUCMM|nr:CACTA en-spm transposon protein [Cucumis melo var. makuwa]
MEHSRRRKARRQKKRENKGFPDAVNNASGDASGKQSFPTHHEGCVGSDIGFNEHREFPFSRRVLRDFSTPRHCVGKSPLYSFQFCKLQNRNREEKKKGEEVVAIVTVVPPPSVAALPRHCPSPPSATLGCVGYPAVMYELAERRVQPIDCVELFRETHVQAGTFVSQAAEDAHNQMLELQSQPTPEGSQPLSEDEICDQVLGRRPGYSKSLGWGPMPKARRTASASSSSTSCSQSTQKEIELQAKLHEALERIEVQDRNHQALASQVEAMKKMIEDLTRAQQGPPHDP